MTSHLAQFLVSDEQWLLTLRVLHRGRLVDLRLPRSGARAWSSGNPVGSRRPVGEIVDTWMNVDLAAEAAVSATRHYAFTHSDEVVSPATLRFRSERALGTAIEAVGFDVDTVRGGVAQTVLAQVRTEN